MSRWITIEAAELAVKALEERIKALEEENIRLKNEVNRLMTIRIRHAKRQNELLEKIDRLTKTGDAMKDLIVDELAFYEDDENQYKEVKNWDVAKNDLDSK